jgi:hypothetical protein
LVRIRLKMLKSVFQKVNGKRACVFHSPGFGLRAAPNLAG